MGQHLSPTVNVIDAVSANDSIQYQFDMSDDKYLNNHKSVDNKLDDDIIIKEILYDLIDIVLHNVVKNKETECY
tara:strand:- start:2315 stop:2536 length:222 start_codon:yes stop_codon:yes gene_type:complete